MKTVAIAHACSRSNTGLSRVYTRALKSSSVQLAQKDDLKQNGKDEPKAQAASPKRKKTMKEIDEELRAAMEGRSGDGGISGAELEGGKAVAMKRGAHSQVEYLMY